MQTKEKSFLNLIFVMLLCFTGITGIVSAASEEGLHSLPPIPSEAVPQWEREYVPGNGDPVVEVINKGMPKALFSLYYTENSADFDDDFYLEPADYSVTVSKGETQIIVAEAGEYYYYSTEAEESDSASWSASANIWLDEDCIYKAVFPDRGYSDKSTEEPTDEITISKNTEVTVDPNSWDPELLRYYSQYAVYLSNLFDPDDNYEKSISEQLKSNANIFKLMEARATGNLGDFIKISGTIYNNFNDGNFYKNWGDVLIEMDDFSPNTEFSYPVYIDGFNEVSKNLENAANNIDDGNYPEASEEFNIALAKVQELDEKFNEYNNDLSDDSKLIYGYDEELLRKHYDGKNSDVPNVGDIIHNFNEMLEITYYSKSVEATSVTPSTPGFIGVTAIIALIATIVLFERKRE